MFSDLPDEGVLLIGIDLDGFVHEGRIDPIALEIVARCHSYAEISPSGRGIKIFGAFRLDLKEQLVAKMGLSKAVKPRSRVQFSRGEHNEIALDRSPRFYTVTNDKIEGCPRSINIIDQGTIDWLIDEAGPLYIGDSEPSAVIATDKSASGYAYRFVLKSRKRGLSKEDTLRALGDDDGPAGEWFHRVDDRQRQRVGENVQALLDAEAADLDTVFDAVDGRAATDPLIQEMNTRHAVVAMNGQTKIATFQVGAIGLGTERDLHTFYANNLVATPDGKRSEPVSKRWMRDKQRRTYRNGMTFLPGLTAPAGALNLFAGYPVKPNPDASCARFLSYLQHIVCADSETAFKYLIGYLAHTVQRPWEKPGVALVFQGPKGAGKDTVVEYLAAVIGQQYVRAVSNPHHVTGKFNAHLETTIVLNLQEGFWAGNHTQESVLKQLITSPQVEIERKGVDLVTRPSCLRIVITANADWVVPASRDERRFAVFEVSDLHCGDSAYFSQLRGEMEGDGPAALLHHLLAIDLSTFDVRRPPSTNALLKQKVRSLRNVDRWWLEELHTGSLGDFSQDWSTQSIEIARETLRERYETWMRQQKHHGEIISPDDFGRRMRELVRLDDTRPRRGGFRIYCYVIPEVDEARSQFESYLGGTIDWAR